VRSLKYYARELKRLGKRDFRLQYGKPALLGVGIVAEVSLGGQRGPTGTMKMTAITDSTHSPSLHGRAWLITKGPDGPTGPAITAGRSAYNDLVIADYTVSDRHCQFRYEPGRILFSDLDSLNGTFVNQRLLGPDERVKLVAQDSVVIGRFMFTFLSGPDFIASVEETAA
jgi:pSer/pThr/pTyr-binding forkhead associated (FHA) protein